MQSDIPVIRPQSRLLPEIDIHISVQSVGCVHQRIGTGQLIPIRDVRFHIHRAANNDRNIKSCLQIRTLTDLDPLRLTCIVPHGKAFFVSELRPFRCRSRLRIKITMQMQVDVSSLRQHRCLFSDIDLTVSCIHSLHRIHISARCKIPVNHFHSGFSPVIIDGHKVDVRSLQICMLSDHGSRDTHHRWIPVYTRLSEILIKSADSGLYHFANISFIQYVGSIERLRLCSRAVCRSH